MYIIDYYSEIVYNLKHLGCPLCYGANPHGKTATFMKHGKTATLQVFGKTIICLNYLLSTTFTSSALLSLYNFLIGLKLF